MRNLKYLSFVTTVCLSLAGCAGTLPGSTDSSNKELFQSENTLKSWVAELQPGMPEAEVFARMGRLKTDFDQLARGEIVDVLFGGRNAGVPPSFQTSEDLKTFLDSLTGYQLHVKSIVRKHGLTSPIRIQTDSTGYDYTLNLIFKNGLLFEKPYLAGGQVNTKSSSTVFDFLSPGLAIDAVSK